MFDLGKENDFGFGLSEGVRNPRRNPGFEKSGSTVLQTFGRKIKNLARQEVWDQSVTFCKRDPPTPTPHISYGAPNVGASLRTS